MAKVVTNKDIIEIVEASSETMSGVIAVLNDLAATCKTIAKLDPNKIKKVTAVLIKDIIPELNIIMTELSKNSLLNGNLMVDSKKYYELFGSIIDIMRIINNIQYPKMWRHKLRVLRRIFYKIGNLMTGITMGVNAFDATGAMIVSFMMDKISAIIEITKQLKLVKFSMLLKMPWKLFMIRRIFRKLARTVRAIGALNFGPKAILDTLKSIVIINILRMAIDKVVELVQAVVNIKGAGKLFLLGGLYMLKLRILIRYVKKIKRLINTLSVGGNGLLLRANITIFLLRTAVLSITGLMNDIIASLSLKSLFLSRFYLKRIKRFVKRLPSLITSFQLLVFLNKGLSLKQIFLTNLQLRWIVNGLANLISKFRNMRGILRAYIKLVRLRKVVTQIVHVLRTFNMLRLDKHVTRVINRLDNVFENIGKVFKILSTMTPLAIIVALGIGIIRKATIGIMKLMGSITTLIKLIPDRRNIKKLNKLNLILLMLIPTFTTIILLGALSIAAGILIWAAVATLIGIGAFLGGLEAMLKLIPGKRAMIKLLKFIAILGLYTISIIMLLAIAQKSMLLIKNAGNIFAGILIVTMVGTMLIVFGAVIGALSFIIMPALIGIGATTLLVFGLFTIMNLLYKLIPISESLITGADTIILGLSTILKVLKKMIIISLAMCAMILFAIPAIVGAVAAGVVILSIHTIINMILGIVSGLQEIANIQLDYDQLKYGITGILTSITLIASLISKFMTSKDFKELGGIRAMGKMNKFIKKSNKLIKSIIKLSKSLTKLSELPKVPRATIMNNIEDIFASIMGSFIINNDGSVVMNNDTKNRSILGLVMTLNKHFDDIGAVRQAKRLLRQVDKIVGEIEDIGKSLMTISEFKVDTALISAGITNIFTCITAVENELSKMLNPQNAEEQAMLNNANEKLKQEKQSWKQKRKIAKQQKKYLSKVDAIIGEIGNIVESINSVKEFKIDTKEITTGVSNIFTCIETIITKLNAGSSTELNNKGEKLLESYSNIIQSLVMDNDSLSGTEKVLNKNIEFLDKIDKVDENKLKSAANIFESLSKFSNSIKGDFNELAEALTEKIAPLLEEMNTTLEKVNGSVKETSSNVATSVNLSNQKSLTQSQIEKQVSIENPNATQEQIRQEARERHVRMERIQLEENSIMQEILNHLKNGKLQVVYS